MLNFNPKNMLSKKEIASLPPGEYSNSVLRKKFTSDHRRTHGHIVPARVTVAGAEVDTEFVGNRSQFRFRMRNKFAPLPEREKPTYQSNRIETKRKMSVFGRVVKFLANLIGYGQPQAA